jgi:hypothetical protein
MRKTKLLLGAMGTLYAFYEFRVYNKKRSRGYGRVTRMSGNDTSSNVRGNIKEMFRHSFSDAIYKIHGLYGGTFDYDSKLLDYYIVYREKKAERMKGVRHTKQYYEKEIPQINRKSRADIYEQLLAERETKTPVKRKIKKTKKKRKN